MKSAHDVAIEQAGDEMIERGPETAIAQYFRIGTKITVSERVSGGWLCGTCTGPDRYELGEHKGCVHIQRVKLWAADHPVERVAA
jgi:hypothetical protein